MVRGNGGKVRSYSRKLSAKFEPTFTFFDRLVGPSGIQYVRTTETLFVNGP